LASALPTPEQTEKVSISLPVRNWIVFYSFVIDHEIQFAYERPLCAKSSHSNIAQTRTLDGDEQFRRIIKINFLS
jgi:hypothetical protein